MGITLINCGNIALNFINIAQLVIIKMYIGIILSKLKRGSDCILRFTDTSFRYLKKININ